MLKLVPFNNAWISHDKIDIKAIYQRPRSKEDEYGEFIQILDENGEQSYDLTGPLPIKQHVKWSQKGFKYLTLASRDALMVAYATNTLLDDNGNVTHDWQQYNQHSTHGPWNYKKYLEGYQESKLAASQDLVNDIAEYGWELVEKLRRRSDPGFSVPDYLKPEFKKAAEAKAAAAEKPKAVEVTTARKA